MQNCTTSHIDSPGRPILISKDLHLKLMYALDSATVLRYDRNVRLPCKLPDTDSVTEKAQYTSIWPNECDAVPLTKIGEPGFPGLDAPARPRRRKLELLTAPLRCVRDSNSYSCAVRHIDL